MAINDLIGELLPYPLPSAMPERLRLTTPLVVGAIQAAKDDDERIKPKKREALIEFESKKDVTLQLVTLKNDLAVPTSTRI